LDLVIVKHKPLISSPLFAYKLMHKKIKASSKVIIIKGMNFQIETDSQYAHIDGEPFQTNQKISIKVNPISLHVII